MVENWRHPPDSICRQRKLLRYQAHQIKSEDKWKKLLSQNKYQGMRRDHSTRRQCHRNHQKNIIWGTIHGTLNPTPITIRADADELNRHFTSTTQRILGTTLTAMEICEIMLTLYRVTKKVTPSYFVKWHLKQTRSKLKQSELIAQSDLI